MLQGLFKKFMTMTADVPEITPTELKARIDNEDELVLVDVRELHEAIIADLPDYGAKLQIPTGEFMGRMSDLNPDDVLVLYCRSGQRSEWAAQLLMQRGFENVLNLKGGVLGWRQEVDPSLQGY